MRSNVHFEKAPLVSRLCASFSEINPPVHLGNYLVEWFGKSAARKSTPTVKAVVHELLADEGRGLCLHFL